MLSYLRRASLAVIALLAVASAATIFLQSMAAVRASERAIVSIRADLIRQNLHVTARDLDHLARGIESRPVRSSAGEATEWLWRFVPGTVAGLENIGEASAQVRGELNAVRGHAQRLNHLTGHASRFARIFYRSDRGFTYTKPPLSDSRMAAFHRFVTSTQWNDGGGAQWKFTERDPFSTGDREPALWRVIPLGADGPARGVLAARVRVEQLRSLLDRGDSLGRSALRIERGQLTADAGLSRIGTTGGGENGGQSAPFVEQSFANNLSLVHHFPPLEPYWTALRASLLPWSVVAIAAALVAFTVHRAQRTELIERRRAERELREAYAKQQTLTVRLRRFANQLATVQQRERKRLAELLHDELQQLLVAARIKQGQERYDEAANLIAQANDVSRDLTQRLRPPALYEAGLVPALRWLAERMESLHSFQVTVDAPDPDQSAALNDDVKVALFESVRELLLNAVKHAAIGGAAVTIRWDEDCLRITVEDCGKGFDRRAIEEAPSSEDFGVGLVGVEERMMAIGGDMFIDSDVSQGTSVHLTLPL